MSIYSKNKTEHERIVYEICKNSHILSKSLNENQLWLRATEYIIDEETNERADIVFQNTSIIKCLKNTICYVVEVKSNQGDHELLGQIEKSVDRIKREKHNYVDVRGIAIVKQFTKSGMALLEKHGYSAFEWVENKNGFSLHDMFQKQSNLSTSIQKLLKNLKS